jgi:hypothetical protein
MLDMTSSPTSLAYFAYGSNMLTERLRQRCKSARFRAVARADGYVLAFTKRSRDGSGKATLQASDVAGSTVYGVVFDLNAAELPDLDRAEGRGSGYSLLDRFPVVTEPHHTAMEVTAYIADSDAVDGSLRPYDWYLQLVVRGAAEHGLPGAYQDALRSTPAVPDPDPQRASRREALDILKRLGAKP